MGSFIQFSLTSSPSTQADELLPLIRTSPSLYFKQTGSSLQISLTSSPFNTGRRAPTIHEDEPFTVLQTDGLLPTNLIDKLSHSTQADELLLFMKTSPSLYFKQTGSSLQISLTSSPFNTGRRAPTIHEDEPFTVLQTDGLLPTNLIDELLHSKRRALHCTSNRQAPPYYSY